MLKRFWFRIKPHIKPETILFFKRILWLGFALGLLVHLTEAPNIIRSDWKLWGFSTLLGIGAVYITRISAWLVLSVIRGIGSIQEEIYTEAELAKKSRRRR